MAETGTLAAIPLPLDEIAAFCEKWGVAELSLFGSVLREDFGPESDVDVLVAYRPGVVRSLLDYPEMQAELAALFGRPVDIANRRAIEKSHNWLRREAILGSARTIYAA